MMQPLSRNKRRYYLIALSVLFVVLTPLLIFYATGYRLGESLTLKRTGGLYVITGQSGVRVYINDEFVRESNLFQKNILIQNLKPGTFQIRTEKDGETTWGKELGVYPERVTEAYVFMLPTELEAVEILSFVDSAGVATSTALSSTKVKHLANPEIAWVKELFLPPKQATSTKVSTPSTGSTGSLQASSGQATTSSTSTPEAVVLNKLALEKVDGRLVATWQGGLDEQPSYFCVESLCQEEILLQTPSSVQAFDFFPGRGDVAIAVLDTGIYAIEIDNRSTQNILPIFTGKNLDMRVRGNMVYIKQGEKFYVLAF